MNEDGWKQIEAGLALIVWSRLVYWDLPNVRLVAAHESEFESGAGHKTVHRDFGRLICWIAFSIGCEYLGKGVLIVKGHSLERDARAIRLPSRDENIQDWINLVNRDDSTIQERVPSLGSLGKYPVEKILPPGPDRDIVRASMRLLAATVRNRDAHRYAENVRAFHFHVVERLFVPMLNVLLGLVDQGKLRNNSTDLGSSR